jgi:hypothetical protein
MEGAPNQTPEGFDRLCAAFGDRLRPLSGAEMSQVDQALNHVGLSPEILANMLDGAEEAAAADAAAKVLLAAAAPDIKSAARHLNELHAIL